MVAFRKCWMTFFEIAPIWLADWACLMMWTSAIYHA